MGHGWWGEEGSVKTLQHKHAEVLPTPGREQLSCGLSMRLVIFHSLNFPCISGWLLMAVSQDLWLLITIWWLVSIWPCRPECQSSRNFLVGNSRVYFSFCTRAHWLELCPNFQSGFPFPSKSTSGWFVIHTAMWAVIGLKTVFCFLLFYFWT